MIAKKRRAFVPLLTVYGTMAAVFAISKFFWPYSSGFRLFALMVIMTIIAAYLGFVCERLESIPLIERLSRSGGICERCAGVSLFLAGLATAVGALVATGYCSAVTLSFLSLLPLGIAGHQYAAILRDERKRGLCGIPAARLVK